MYTVVVLSGVAIFLNAYFFFFSQVITFIDLAGHERYLKTTIFGMTGHVPDFAMLMVSLNVYKFMHFVILL